MNVKVHVFALAALLTVASTGYAAQTFDVDQSHASVGFTISHLVISNVRGEFRDFEGQLVLDDEGNLTQISANIQVGSIDTGIQGRDDHLRGADFFNIEEFPQMTFVGTSISKNVIVGNLTIHGVTKEVKLPYEIKGPVKGPMGKTRIGFEASTVINRAEYGLTWNKAMETGGVVVGEEVNLMINLEAIQQ